MTYSSYWMYVFPCIIWIEWINSVLFCSAKLVILYKFIIIVVMIIITLQKLEATLKLLEETFTELKIIL